MINVQRFYFYIAIIIILLLYFFCHLNWHAVSNMWLTTDHDNQQTSIIIVFNYQSCSEIHLIQCVNAINPNGSQEEHYSVALHYLPTNYTTELSGSAWDPSRYLQLSLNPGLRSPAEAADFILFSCLSASSSLALWLGRAWREVLVRQRKSCHSRRLCLSPHGRTDL